MTRSTSETSRLRALKADPAVLTLRWLIMNWSGRG